MVYVKSAVPAAKQSDDGANAAMVAARQAEEGTREQREPRMARKIPMPAPLGIPSGTRNAHAPSQAAHPWCSSVLLLPFLLRKAFPFVLQFLFFRRFCFLDIHIKNVVRCLCLMVRHLTHDTDHVISHLNLGMGMMLDFVERAREDSKFLDDWQLLDGVNRYSYIICNILHTLDLDAMLHHDDAPPQVNHLPANPAAMPIFNFKKLTYAPAGGCISNSVAEVLCDLYNLNHPKLQFHLIMPLGFFLSNHRVYIKNRRVLDIFKDALGSSSFLLRNMGLTMLRDLLVTFEKAAMTESVAGKQDGDSKEEEQQQKGPSASDSAQPLSCNLDLAMESLLHGSSKMKNPHENADHEKARKIKIIQE